MPASGRRLRAPAVCFAPGDYAGLWRRLAVELVDLCTIVVLGVVVAAVVVLVIPDEAPGDAVLLAGWAALVYGYFVILKRSRFRTLGYRLARVRLVDVRGRPPGVGALSVRLLFAVAGPINVVLDMMWIPSDRCRQSLRDKIAHTYVVKAQARPAGSALIVYRQYSLMGMSFLFQELEPLAGTVVVLDRDRSS